MAIYKVENGVAIAYADVALSGGGTPTPSEQTLSSIAVTTPPTKTVYEVGDMLDLSGMVVTATYSDGTTADVSRSVITNPIDGALLAFGTNQVSIRYTESGITKTTTQAIIVGESTRYIYIATPPTKLGYNKGESLDLTGMVVKYSDDGSETDVTSSVTTSPSNGATLTMDNDEVVVSYTVDGITYTVSQPIYVYGIYGVEWDGSSSSTLTRTDDAVGIENPSPAVNNGNGYSPFDNIMPWSGMTVVEDANAGTVVSIPKFYYKWTKTGNSMKLRVSPTQFTDSLVSPAHADRGDGNGERDVVYVGRYTCGQNYKSVSQNISVTRETISTFRNNIHQLGSDVWQFDYAMYCTIAMLYLVEYASWNSQEKIGHGTQRRDSSNFYRMGTTDSMLYHTGTTAETRDGDGFIQYRHIEGIWSGVDNFVDGIYFTGQNVYAIKNPVNFSNTSGGTLIGQQVEGTSRPVKSFDLSAVSGFEYILLPKTISEIASDYTVYTCDSYNTGGSALRVFGGDAGSGSSVGIFHHNSYDQETSESFGCRLMVLP